MQCPFCQREHPKNAVFCPVTGKALIKPETPDIGQLSDDTICPHCSKKIPSNSLFCPHCGNAITYQTQAPTPPSEIIQPPPSIEKDTLSVPPQVVDKSPSTPPPLAEKEPAISLRVEETFPEIPLHSSDKTPSLAKKKKSKIGLILFLALIALVLVAIGTVFVLDERPDKVLSIMRFEKPTLEVKNTIDISNYLGTPTPGSSSLLFADTPNQNEIANNPNGTLNQGVQVTTQIPPTMTSTSTPSPTTTPTIVLANIEVQINFNDQAEMVFIPAGEFLMGSDPDTDPYFWGAEGPSHRVYLDGYWIYRYEVTNGMYEACVSNGACPRPESYESRTRPEYYGNVDYVNYPVINVDYTSALSYCRWAGGRLPTEAEWEKAARGDIDQRTFPWGSTPAEGNQANFCDRGCPGQEIDHDKEDGYNDTAPIGSYPDGMSIYGLYDMAGNVWEWTFDYFNAGYYQASPEKNPKGPQSSQHRVIRGGGWNNPSSGVRIVQRTGVNPDMALDTLGFRCAMDVK